MTVDAAIDTDVMRHVPPHEFVVRKLSEYRERSEKLLGAVYESGRAAAADPELLARTEAEFASLALAVERLGDIAARHVRAHPHTDNLRVRLDHAFSSALAAVNGIDKERFIHRSPCTSFFRAPGEPVFAALLVVGFQFQRLLPLAGQIAPDVYELLLAPLVKLTHPVNEEVLRPIA